MDIASVGRKVFQENFFCLLFYLVDVKKLLHCFSRIETHVEFFTVCWIFSHLSPH